MKLEFVRDGPALVVEGEERLLVIADLHFGIEAGLATHGLHFRSRSRARLERVLRTIDATTPDRLVLLGDVKHSIPTLTRQEYYELPEILKTLRDRVPILVFPGNHDIGIERFLSRGEIRPRDGAVIDGVGYLHGHTYPSPELAGRLLVTGHHHPLLTLNDEVGCALQEPAYIRAPVDTARLNRDRPGGDTDAVPGTRALLVPAFNEIAGYDLTRILRDPFSPISRCLKIDEAEIILADGTYIGPLRAVEQDEGD